MTIVQTRHRPSGRRGRRLGIFSLAGVAALLLSSCKVDVTVEFRSDGSSHTDATAYDSNGSMRTINRTCANDLAPLVKKTLANIGEKAQIEDVSTPETLACRVTAEGNLLAVKLQDKGDHYVIKTGPKPNLKKDLEKQKQQGITKSSYTITIVMPGKITKATGGGVIDGNKVTYQGIAFTVDGVEIVASKNGKDAPSTTGSETTGSDKPTTSTSKSTTSGNSSGFPVWGWAAIGGGTLALIAGGLFTLSRKKKQTPSTYPPNGPGTPYPPNGPGTYPMAGSGTPYPPQ